MPSPDEIMNWLRRRVAEKLGLEIEEVGLDTPLDAFGLGSREAVELAADLNREWSLNASATVVYDFPTLRTLCAHLAGEDASDFDIAAASPGEPIAIVGIGCRFPGAGEGPAQLLAFLSEGRSGIQDVPNGRWDVEASYGGPAAGPGQTCTRWVGLLDDIAGFEPEFFGVPPAEAERMDPHQRLVLEAAVHAIEDAGLRPADLAGTATGVFVGVSQSEYARHQIAAGDIAPATATGSALSIAANRVSYLLDLQGPSLAIDTACSSSLVAVHTACESLHAGDCEFALAGGVNVVLTPDLSIALTAAGLMSPDGSCHAFDDRANGYVRGEGVGVVLLQPLSRALAQGRPIYATIEGGAVVQDGRSQGLMAPRGPAQQKTILMACRRAGISPAQLDYVETHGTGTALGDVIEATALGAIFAGERERPCPIGSVKSNIGHLESAAGVAGLIKTALVLQTRTLLPNHDFQVPNGKIPFADLKLEVVASARPFGEERERLYAGVSSFGFGGTNAHLVLASPPEPTARGEPTPLLVGLSAPTAEALELYRERVVSALEDERFDASLRARWLPALSARTSYNHRLAAAGSDLREVAQRLRGAEIGEAARPASITFAYSGQGAMWPGVGRDLFQSSEPFRLALLEADDAIRAHAGRSVLPTLFGDESEASLADTAFAQPAIFALQVGLTAHLRALGVAPTACVGHSVGEIAAAYAAGALGLQDAARVVCARATAMAPTRGLGAMLALRLSRAEAEALIAPGDDLELATVNGPRSVVCSGSVAAIADLEKRCREAGIDRHRLPVDYAFHSRQMDEAASVLAETLAELAPVAPALRLAPTVSGADEGDLRDASYWARNVREAVAFQDAVGALDDGGVFVEIGAQPVLSRDIDATVGRPGAAIATLRRRGDGPSDLLATVAQLFSAGALPSLPSAPALLAPPRAWARSAYWYAPRAQTRESRASYLTHRTQLAAGGGEVWSGEIRFPDDADLLDHRVFGFALMPAAAYIDIFLRVGRELAGRSLVLEDVRFVEPLVLTKDRSIELQVGVQPSDDGWALSLFARPDDDGSRAPWRRHASAVARPGRGEEAPAPANLDRIKSRCFDQYPGPAFYDLLQQKGLDYGPRFQGLASVVGVRGEALGRLKAPLGNPRAHRIAPSLLDSALQTAAASFGARRVADAQEAAPIPVRIERIVAWDTAGQAEWSHVTGGKDQGSVRTVEVSLLDGSGEASMRLEGVTLKGSQKGAALELETRAALDRWLYALEWRAAPASERIETAAAVAVLCDDADGMNALLTHAQSSGRPTLGLAREGSPGARIPGVLALTEWSGAMKACAAAGFRPDAVVAFVPEADPEDPAGVAGLAQASGLVQGIQAQALEAPRIVLVTRGAEVLTSEDRGAFADAALFGFQRALLIEHPDLDCVLLDLPQAPSPASTVAAVDAVLGRDASEPHLAWRDGELRVPRLVRRHAPTAHRRLDASGVYLVTGANGALGAQAALGLCELGARRLWLTGRNRELAAALRQQLAKSHPQVEVRYSVCDLTQVAEIRALLSEVQASGALRGVVHAAGALDDSPIVKMEPRHFEDVVGPKSLAAYRLDRELAEAPLDFFVAFSSAAAVLGSPGQGNYCAANAQLDGLARRRAKEGRPYLSIAWGAWSGDGLARGSRLTESRLIDTIAPQVGRELIKHLLGETGHVLVFPTALAALAQFYPSHSGLGLFREVAGAAIVSTRGGRTGERAYTRPDLPIEYVAPRTEIEHAIVGIWQRAIGMTGIGVQDELFALGGDSVLASQILALVNKTYGIVIDPEEAYQSFTVERLASSVDEHLLRLVEALDDETVDELVSASAG